MKCSAITTITHEKCKNLIGGDTPSPCYEGPYKLPSFKETKPKLHWYCARDIEKYVMGKVYDVVLCRPTIRLVWPMKRGTNLTTTEVLMLNDGGFFIGDIRWEGFIVPYGGGL